MADVYRDLVYTRNTSSIGATDTTLTVEDVSLFPPSALLVKSDFWLTIESPLSYPNTFEIVKLTGVDTATKTLTVVRGQAGTTAVAHAIAIYIKGALTSDMLRRARAGLSGTTLPPADTDIFLPGDRFYHLTEQRYYAHTGQAVSLNDTFTRAASTTTMGATETVLSPNIALPWNNVVGVFGINANNHAAYQSGAVSNRACSLVNVGSTDFDVSIQMNSGVSTEYSGLAFRMTADGRFGYNFLCQPTQGWYLNRVNADVYTNYGYLGVASASAVATVRIRCVGTSIQIWLNASQVLNLTEASPPTQIGTNVGPLVNSASALTDATIWWDNFTCTSTSGVLGGWQPTADIPGFFGALLPRMEVAQSFMVAQADDLLDTLTLDDTSLQRSIATIGALVGQVDEVLDRLTLDDTYLQHTSQIFGVLAHQLDDILDASVGEPWTAVTSNYQATTSDGVMVANGTLTITLPIASAAIGKIYIVKNSGTGTITITPGSGAVDGSANTTLTTQYAHGRYASDGTNYWIV